MLGVPLTFSSPSSLFAPSYLALRITMRVERAGKRQRGEAHARALEGQFANLFTAFESISTEMREFDEKREVVIKKSRDVQKNSKQAIFSVHRGDIAQASSRLDAAEAGYTELLTLIDETPALRGGSFSHALEEYAEARIFLHFYVTKQLLVPADLPQVSELFSLRRPHTCRLGCSRSNRPRTTQINTEEYLGGLLDFTGELNRWAVIQATSRKVDDVKYARDCVDAVLSVMMELDLRNGAIRKKYDSLKYCLKNLEKVLYELSLGQDIDLLMNAEKEEKEAANKEET